MFRELVRKKQQISQEECIDILKKEKQYLQLIHEVDQEPKLI